jgi:tRNA (adenine-N(1)-)-methyltransferase non-catalytic subunit
MKKDGLSGVDVINQITKNSKTFENKTEFSQKKYLKKKHKKHTFQFRVI